MEHGMKIRTLTTIGTLLTCFHSGAYANTSIFSAVVASFVASSNLNGTNATSAIFMASSVVSSNLNGTNATSALFMASSVVSSTLNGTNATSALFMASSVVSSNLNGTNATSASFMASSLVSSNLHGTNATSAIVPVSTYLMHTTLPLTSTAGAVPLPLSSTAGPIVPAPTTTNIQVATSIAVVSAPCTNVSDPGLTFCKATCCATSGLSALKPGVSFMGNCTGSSAQKNTTCAICLKHCKVDVDHGHGSAASATALLFLSIVTAIIALRLSRISKVNRED